MDSYNWDLSKIYSSEEQIENDVQKLKEILAKVDDYSDNQKESLLELLKLNENLNFVFINSIETKEKKLSILSKNPYISDFNNVIENKSKLITTLKKQLEEKLSLETDKKQLHLEHLISMLDAVSPLKVLKRGYAVVEKNKITVDSVKRLKIDDNLTIRLSDGQINAIVTNIKGEK